MAYQQNGRVAGFVAVNKGTVEGCATNVLFREKSGGAGFVFENQGKINSSVAIRCVKGKNGKGFYYRNAGTIGNSAYLAPDNMRMAGSNGQILYRAGNPELFLSSATSPELVYRRLALEKVWEKPARSNPFALEPDIATNHVRLLPAGKNVTTISTPAELQQVIAAVNAGDRDAASANYRLVGDLNMKGASLAPLGLSESRPFTGTFDGNGMVISNFKIPCKGLEFGGFFGYTKNAKVANLTVDYLLRGAGGIISGGMVGCADGGLFNNCHVRAGMTPGLCTGGFAGKNTGTLKNCYVCGKLSAPVSPLPFAVCGAAVAAGILIATGVILISRWSGKDDFRPGVIDPNQTPVTDAGSVEPPPPGTSRISLELNQDIYVRASTMVGQMDYVNPQRSTHDVVLRICISDKQLIAAGDDPVAVGVRTAQELAAEDYDPAKAYTQLYRSGRLQVGYKLSLCKLEALPNGEKLKPGDYEMTVFIDAYDPVTNEKAIVNAQAATTVHIVNQ